ncbi:MAG: hypothetical protein QXF15_03390 [Candidatus Aenigmatarchaeota archaeon]|nr:hypothetical protein [Candidatus Aenigmarchaeota archaeon]
MKISEIKNGMNNINLSAKVIDISEPKQVTTKNGIKTTVTTAILDDGSGKTIKCALWGEQADGIDSGVEVEINGAFVKEFKGEMQLGISKNGFIKIIGYFE